jgi:hypothetical protein
MFWRLLHLKSEKGDGYDSVMMVVAAAKGTTVTTAWPWHFWFKLFFSRLEFSTMVRWSLQAPTRCWWRRTGYAVSIRELQRGLVSECAESIRIPWSHGLIMFNMFNIILPYILPSFAQEHCHVWIFFG